MGMLELPGTLRAGSIKMEADATGGGDSIGNKFSQKFSFVDSVPATDGVKRGHTYTYTISGVSGSFYYAKLTLSGKDSWGIHRTVEIEVFNEELQSLLLSNINAGEIDVAVYGDTIRVSPFFAETWFFTNHVEGYTGILGGGNGFQGERAIIMGGAEDSPYRATIDYYSIGTLSDATEFGELTEGRGQQLGCMASGSRGMCTGGRDSAHLDTMDYVEMYTYSNAIDFGELTQARAYFGGGSDGHRGVQTGGSLVPSPYTNVIDYQAIMTAGDATDFGDRTAAYGWSDNTLVYKGRGVNVAGYNGGNLDTCEMITIGTLGNAIDYGEYGGATRDISSFEGGSRGITANSPHYDDQDFQYYELTTNISSAEYGEIGYSTANPMGTSNGSRGTISGGYSPPGGPPDGLDTITYVTITTRGSGTDFGELTQGRHGGGATSG